MKDHYGFYWNSDRNVGSQKLVGHREVWFQGGSEFRNLPGIRVEKEDLTLPSLILSASGIPLGSANLYPIMGLQDKFYDESSTLVKGTSAVAIYSVLRDFLGERLDSDFSSGKPLVSIAPGLPQKIISIFAEETDQIYKAAQFLKIPLRQVL